MSKIVTSAALQEELELTGYDVYQYARRGLREIPEHPGYYDLEKAREWIQGFGNREAKRERIKKDLLELPAEARRIVTEPKGNTQYAVVWGNTAERQARTIQRALYLMVQYSTSRADNLVYISPTSEQAQAVQAIIESDLGELAQGFRALTMPDLAKEITQSKSVAKAVQLLENDPTLQEKYGLIYRTFVVETYEQFTGAERRLFELLTTYYGGYMVNVTEEAVGKNEEVSGWLQQQERVVLNNPID